MSFAHRDSFRSASKRTGYLGINITKKTKDLFIEIYKILLRKIKESTDKWKYISCSQTGRINFIKLFVLVKTIPIKILKACFIQK